MPSAPLLPHPQQSRCRWPKRDGYPPSWPRHRQTHPTGNCRRRLSRGNQAHGMTATRPMPPGHRSNRFQMCQKGQAKTSYTFNLYQYVFEWFKKCRLLLHYRRRAKAACTSQTSSVYSATCVAVFSNSSEIVIPCSRACFRLRCKSNLLMRCDGMLPAASPRRIRAMILPASTPISW